MMPSVFDTQALRQRDQQEAWREWFRPAFEVTPRGCRRGSFPAKNIVWRLDGIVVCRLHAPAASGQRTPRHIRRDPIDHWVLAYCQRGGLSITTETCSLQTHSGTPLVWSLGQAFDAERTATDLLQLFLSRDAFQDMAPVLDAACGVVLDTPLVCLLGDFLLCLERRLQGLATSETPRITSALRALIAACLAPSADRMAIARNQLDFGRRERVRQVVRSYLHSPSLTPDVLGRAVGISRSNLYRLLELDGGVVHYIRQQRLLEANKILMDAKLTRPISAIADGLCFPDPSSFSRAFRAVFGYSPSEVRAAAIAGHALPRAPDRISTVAESRFTSFLQGH